MDVPKDLSGLRLDEALRRVAAKLAKWIRPMDFAARTGGAAAPPWRRLTADALIELADQQLYASKQAGRNRVSFETPQGTGASPEERAMLLEPFARDGKGG